MRTAPARQGAPFGERKGSAAAMREPTRHPLQRFTIEIAPGKDREPAAVDVFIRNLFDDEMLIRALVERGAVGASGQAVGYDAIYPGGVQIDGRVSILADYIQRRGVAIARYAVVIGLFAYTLARRAVDHRRESR